MHLELERNEIRNQGTSEVVACFLLIKCSKRCIHSIRLQCKHFSLRATKSSLCFSFADREDCKTQESEASRKPPGEKPLDKWQEIWRKRGFWSKVKEDRQSCDKTEEREKVGREKEKEAAQRVSKAHNSEASAGDGQVTQHLKEEIQNILASIAGSAANLCFFKT